MAVAKINNKIVAPVVEKKVPETKYGATWDMVLGTELVGDLSFDGLTTVPAYGLCGRFAKQGAVFADKDVTISFPDLENVDFFGMQFMFATFYGGYVSDNTKVSILFPKLKTIQTSGLESFMSGSLNSSGTRLAKLDFSSLETIGQRGLLDALKADSLYTNCILESVTFPKLVSIGNSGMQSCFADQNALKTVDFPELTTLGTYAMRSTFSRCTALQKISFPSLTTVASNSFGGTTSTYNFYGCTALTEIHFRADAQTAIEAMTGYATKWGATNATIYFDL